MGNPNSKKLTSHHKCSHMLKQIKIENAIGPIWTDHFGHCFIISYITTGRPIPKILAKWGEGWNTFFKIIPSNNISRLYGADYVSL